MPFKSKAQQRYLEMLASRGKFTGNIKEWEASTNFKRLPARVATKKKGAKRRKRKISRSTTS